MKKKIHTHANKHLCFGTHWIIKKKKKKTLNEPWDIDMDGHVSSSRNWICYYRHRADGALLKYWK